MTTINLGLILAGQNIPALESIPCLGDFANPMTPKPSPRHVFPAWAGRALPAWWSMPPSLGGGLYVCGPSGCGKSSSIREWCARTGTPLYQVTANGRLEFPDLVGHVSLESDGQGGTRTSFVHGPLARAMKEGGVLHGDSCVGSRVVASALAVACGGEAEQLMRLNIFPAVLGDEQP